MLIIDGDGKLAYKSVLSVPGNIIRLRSYIRNSGGIGPLHMRGPMCIAVRYIDVKGIDIRFGIAPYVHVKVNISLAGVRAGSVKYQLYVIGAGQYAHLCADGLIMTRFGMPVEYLKREDTCSNCYEEGDNKEFFHIISI